MAKSPRYPRPYLEVEFDQVKLRQPGCCRAIPVVIRLCGLPPSSQVQSTIIFERIYRSRGDEGEPLGDYIATPTYCAPRKNFPGYLEYAEVLLARAHSAETGTIRISVTSRGGTLLCDAVLTLDSRESEPVLRLLKERSFRGRRFVPFLRNAAQRDALNGQYPISVHMKEIPLPSHEKRSALVKEDQLSLFHAEPPDSSIG